MYFNITTLKASDAANRGKKATFGPLMDDCKPYSAIEWWEPHTLHDGSSLYWKEVPEKFQNR